MEKAKKSMPKHLSTPSDQAALDEFEDKDKLFQMISKSRSYNKHLTHKALYDALSLSSVDEDDMEKELKQSPVHKKRRRDDHDQEALTDAKKISKKKKRKDSDAPSSMITKDQPNFSKKGTTPSKPLESNKSVQADEAVKEHGQEEAIDDEEPAVDEVFNTEEHPQDDSKDLNADVGPKQNWFHELEETAKDSGQFYDLIGSTIDFLNFIKHCLKKDQITKANLECPVFKLLKRTCRNRIELEYHLEQHYFAFFDQLDWTNPEGDRCPYDLSKPLPLPGRLTITVEFFFNNDLKYLKNGNKERKYVASVTKTKAARLMIDNQLGYRYLKEIIVNREDLKEYSFREADFSRINLNDIEDLFLLNVQQKICNLSGDEIVHLVNVLCMFTKSIIIKRRVEDMQMVQDNLHGMMHNFKMGYDDARLKRKWSEKDQERTAEMLKLIDDLLLERRIMRSLECYVG
nr:hypothetical protein [Tanacetum cinerariifolium]